MADPSHDDWVRLAAFIDGEGSILINERNSPRRSNWGSYLRIVIANTDPRLPLWLRDTFGRTIAVIKNTSNPRARHALKWHVSCTKAAELLRGCLPHLLLKREQADIGLAYQATMRKLSEPSVRLTHEVIAQRTAWREQLHGLRKKRFPLEELQVLKGTGTAATNSDTQGGNIPSTVQVN